MFVSSTFFPPTKADLRSLSSGGRGEAGGMEPTAPSFLLRSAAVATFNELAVSSPAGAIVVVVLEVFTLDDDIDAEAAVAAVAAAASSQWERSCTDRHGWTDRP